MGYKIAPREIAAVLSYKAVICQDQAGCRSECEFPWAAGFMDLSHLSSLEWDYQTRESQSLHEGMGLFANE